MRFNKLGDRLYLTTCCGIGIVPVFFAVKALPYAIMLCVVAIIGLIYTWTYK